MGAAHFNVLMYPETGETAARHLEKALGQPFTKVVPDRHRRHPRFPGRSGHDHRPARFRPRPACASPGDAASVDSTYLTGKRVFIFGDGTHVIAAARIAAKEIGFEVVGLGCYNREQARPLRAAAKTYGIEALITDDYLEVEAEIARLQPELILGTQMERHIAKRLGIPCAVISRPGACAGLPRPLQPPDGVRRRECDLRHLGSSAGHGAGRTPSDHVPRGFRVSRRRRAQPSRRQGNVPRPDAPEAAVGSLRRGYFRTENAGSRPATGEVIWLADAERELKKIPFFVRGKAKRNTEKFAADKGVTAISIDTLYEAKAHYAR